MLLTLTTIIKDNTAAFSFYRQGYLYYTVVVAETTYVFPIEAADLQTATVNATEKAITLMRYIRKALADGTFVVR